MDKYFIIIDIGTGNMRVALVNVNGEVVNKLKQDMEYEINNKLGPNVFIPKVVFTKVESMIRKLIQHVDKNKIIGISSTSQRQGIVILDNNNKAKIGLANIYNSDYQENLSNDERNEIREITGRYPSNTFSLYKILGLQNSLEDFEISSFTSISDWICYEFTNEIVYEKSQATETLLYDIREDKWSSELKKLYNIKGIRLPQLVSSGKVIPSIKPNYEFELGLKPNTPFIVGGADTQTAIKATLAKENDIVIVSGTTSPVVKISNENIKGISECWFNKHINNGLYLLEYNGGATGLNYQRIKNMLFPNIEYEELEDKILAINEINCLASFSTMDFKENQNFQNGGFLLNSPLQDDLKSEDLVKSVILDISFSIVYNLRLLELKDNESRNNLIGCGGGFQSKIIPQIISDLSGKYIQVLDNYMESSIIGTAYVCNEALDIPFKTPKVIKRYKPNAQNTIIIEHYNKWLEYRNHINKI